MLRENIKTFTRKRQNVNYIISLQSDINTTNPTMNNVILIYSKIGIKSLNKIGIDFLIYLKKFLPTQSDKQILNMIFSKTSKIDGLPERTDLLENLVLNFSKAMLFTNIKWDGGVLVLIITDFLDLVKITQKSEKIQHQFQISKDETY